MTDYEARGIRCLYRMYGTNSQLLYIGIAVNPEERWRHHESTEWWPLVDRKSVEWFDDFESAASAEAKAIRTEHPQYNGTHARRPGEVSSAYVTQKWRTFLDRVGLGEAVTVTKNGRPMLTAVPPDWYRRAVAAIGEPQALIEPPARDA